MSNYPPYMNAYGLIPKILGAIKEAKTPPRFTQDFLETGLGFSGGSARAFLPLAKRLGLLSGDGAPTDLYDGFRNPTESSQSMARAVRAGYSALFDRNEYAHKLDRKALEGLLIQVTGLDADSQTLRAIASSFEALKQFADFDMPQAPIAAAGQKQLVPDSKLGPPDRANGNTGDRELRMNLAYTINLNLPKSDDVAVFNAIFKALRENLLR